MNARNSFKFVLPLCLLPMLFLPVSVTQAARSTCGGWSVVKSPNVEIGHNYLEAVAAVSASDIWAVGSVYGHFPYAQTLIEHWNGQSWQVVPSPNTAAKAAFLTGVTAISANNIWAVGHYYNNSDVSQALIAQWNGTSWRVVPSPDLGNSNNSLQSVAAVSSSDIWAVGSYQKSSDVNVSQTLIEQWNGTSWQVVPSPNPGIGDSLQGVAVVSASDIWAVGNYGAEQTDHTLIEQWNGTHWMVVSSPSPGVFTNYLQAGAVVSASDVWAMGQSDASTLIEHWNGASWQVVPSPNASGGDALSGAAAISANNIWTVGSSQNDNGVNRTLIEQWNGTSWQIIDSPKVGNNSNDLLGVVAVSASDIWAVGDNQNDNGIYQTLIEHYC